MRFLICCVSNLKFLVSIDLYDCLNKLRVNQFKEESDMIIKIDVDNQNNIICLTNNNILIIDYLSYSKELNLYEELNTVDSINSNEFKIEEVSVEPSLIFQITKNYNNLIYWENNNNNEKRFVVNNKEGIYFIYYNLIKKEISNYYSLDYNISKM